MGRRRLAINVLVAMAVASPTLFGGKHGADARCGPAKPQTLAITPGQQSGGEKLANEPTRSTPALSGWVLDAQSKEPISLASLEVHQVGGPYESTAWADKNGRFELAQVPAGIELRILVTAPEYITETTFLETASTPEDNASDLNIWMVRGLRVKGSLLDALTDKPVRGVEVSLRHQGHFKAKQFDVNFWFHELVSPERPEFSLEVSADGYCPMIKHFNHVIEDESIEIRMIPSARYRIAVVDDDGAPLPKARVRCAWVETWRTVETPAPLTPWLEEGWSLLTGPSLGITRVRRVQDHEFELDWIPHRDPIAVRGYLRGFERRTSLALPAAGGPGSVESVTLTLNPETAQGSESELATVRGRVRANGRPGTGRLRWIGDHRSGFDDLEPDGSFELQGLRPGAITLLPDLGGEGESRLDSYFRPGMPFADQSPTLDLSPGDSRAVDLDLTIPMASLTGRLEDRLGQPIPDRSIRVESSSWPLRSPDPKLDLPFSSMDTDAEGRFRFQVPLELAPYRISFRHGGTEQSVVLEAAPTAPLEFELPPTRRLAIQAIDRVYEQRLHFELHHRAVGTEGYHRIQEAPTSKKVASPSVGAGSPRIFEVPIGTHDLLIRANGRIPIHLEAVQVVEDESPLEIDIEFEARYFQRIALARGVDPIPAHYRVLLLEEDLYDSVEDPWRDGGRGAPYPGTTPMDARGVQFKGSRTARLGPLPPGRYRFKVFPPDIAIEPEYIEMGTSDQRVELRWE